MELLKLMTKYYIDTAKRALKFSIKNWPVMFALVIYSVILALGGILLSKLSFLGGLVLAIIAAACTSSYLYLIENIINNRIADTNDFKNSFTPYLGRVMNITFYIWIASLLYGLIADVIIKTPYGNIINTAVLILVVILLNPLPEMIYQTNNSETGVFPASFNFMKENFIEWAVPNLLFNLAIYYLFGGNIGLSFSLSMKFSAVGIIKFLLGLFVVLFMMVYRGILFRFLNGSTRRSRLFKLRMLSFK